MNPNTAMMIEVEKKAKRNACWLLFADGFVLALIITMVYACCSRCIYSCRLPWLRASCEYLIITPPPTPLYNDTYGGYFLLLLLLWGHSWLSNVICAAWMISLFVKEEKNVDGIPSAHSMWCSSGWLQERWHTISSVMCAHIDETQY